MPRDATINEYFVAGSVDASDMDLLWAQGWRHFGTYFFRYSIAEHEGTLCHVQPLRLKLADFVPSRSQRRGLKRNQVSTAGNGGDQAIRTDPTYAVI